MTIDQTNGYLYFVFYDRRNYSSLQTDVYMAVSKDGGNTFTNFKISESPFIVNSNNYIGHYIGVSAHNNIIRPVWTRIDNNFPSLWTALIDSVPTVGITSKEVTPSGFVLYQNYPNPFNPKTIIKYQIPELSFVTIKVFDVLGNEVATLVDGERLAGKYEVEFSINKSQLTSGTYFYQLEVYSTGSGVGSYIQTKKMVLLK
ncbi:MAG: hypothetical protein DRQ13_03920 [Ignavibacteriae bacterium]|nr:MAG: hypothetical protein DRQ13_03920 [Ignavibacteriota bacterium]